MPRLIDAEVLLKKLDWLEEYDYIEFDAVKRTVDEVPTVDTVRHGHWVDEMGMILCSECGDSWGTEMEELARCFIYCPICGAKMDLNEVENG